MRQNNNETLHFRHILAAARDFIEKKRFQFARHDPLEAPAHLGTDRQSRYNPAQPRVRADKTILLRNLHSSSLNDCVLFSPRLVCSPLRSTRATHLSKREVRQSLRRRKHGVRLSGAGRSVHKHGALRPGQRVLHALLHKASVEKIPGLLGGERDAVQLVQFVL